MSIKAEESGKDDERMPEKKLQQDLRGIQNQEGEKFSELEKENGQVFKLPRNRVSRPLSNNNSSAENNFYRPSIR